MSIEEIKAAMADESVKGEILEFMMPDAQKHLESKGHIIRTKDQDESFINSQVEEKIKSEISTIHKKYDDDLFEILGKRKSPTQKTYEFMKEEIKGLKEKASKSGDQVDKDKLSELEAALAKMTQEKEAATQEIQEKYFRKTVDGVLSAQFDRVTIATPPHLKTEEEKQAYIANQKRMLKTDFLSKYTAKEDAEGNPVYYLGDKMVSSSTDGKALTAAQIIDADYSQYFVKNGKQQPGAGTGKGEIPTNGFTTKEQINTYLKEKGLDPTTKAYSDELLKLVKEHGVTS